MSPTTLIDLMDRWRAELPERVAYRFLAEGEAVTEQLSYRELADRVDRTASGLQQRCAAGDRVGLLFTPSPDFIVAFLAVLRAGCVAVPVAPPTSPGASAVGLNAILADAGPSVVLSDLPAAVVAGWLGDRWPALAPGDLPGGAAEPFRAPDHLAFLQYTSGSTGRPKGVMVSHANLVANQAQIERAFGQDQDAVIVSWLPFFHDMGLIGGILHGLWLGATAVLMPPEAFLRKPVRWLRAISEHRGTISPAPNFGYELCLRRLGPDDVAELDLSSWRKALNGSEPVGARVMADFADRFASAGLDRASLVPCYGLAEATLLVSGSTGGAAAHGREVSCGPWYTDELLVVRDGAVLPDGQEGEIWVRGPSVAEGYWHKPEATAETFGARLPGDDRTFLRTGDLGRVEDGEIRITGRLKDLLIVRGRNHHPQDVEQTVQGVDPRFVRGSGAAFTVDDGVVVVQALRGALPDGPELAEQVLAAVALEHGLTLAELVLVGSSGVPKTSSGKIRRAHCRDRYLAGELTVLARFGRATGPEQGDVRTRLSVALAGVLGLDPDRLTGDRPLTGLGLDSMLAMTVQQLLLDDFGATVELPHLLAGATVDDLAALLPSAPVDVLTAGPVLADRAELARRLTRGQQALWFLSRLNEGGAAAYVLARAVEVLGDLDEPALRSATVRLVQRHPQLRSRFVEAGGDVRRQEWQIGDHDWFTAIDAGADLTAAVSAEAARPIDLSADPLFRIVLLRPDSGSPVLLVVAAHLIADLYSFATVMSDLAALYGGAELGPAAGLERAVEDELRYLDSDEGRAAVEQWGCDLQDAPPLPLPRDRERTSGTRFTGDVRTLRFSAGSADRLEHLARARGCTGFAVLFAAFHAFLARIGGEDDLVIGVPAAVRADPELARAVGYLINMVPVRLDAREAATLEDLVDRSSAAVSAALARARVPLSSLVQRLGTDGEPSPLFQVSCGFHDDRRLGPGGLAGIELEVDGARALLAGIELRSWPLPGRTAVTDLDVTFGRVGDEVVMRFNYSTEVFDPDTAAALADSLRVFVCAALDEPEAPLAGLPLCAGDPAVLLPQPLPIETGVSLADRFRQHVAALPDQPAMVQGDRTWSYAELGCWSEALAQRLPAADRLPGRPVAALFFGGEPRFVAGMLAALQAGYAFMPVMPDLPAERIQYMLANAEVGAVLAAPDDVERVRGLLDAAGREAAVLPVDHEAVPPGNGAPLPPRPADALAYVVHTSGTTGRPKAVMIGDDTVTPLLVWQQRTFGVGPGTRMAQTCSLSFDVGLQELLTVLMFGGAICLPLPDERYSAQGFGRFLARDGVTALYATPTFVRELTAHRTPMHSIQVVQIAGELLTSTVVENVRPLFGPGCRIFNGYGPTETSINCSMHLTEPRRDPRGAVLPVGLPTGLARLYVLDRHRQPLPRLVHGEVYIGGPGVGPGYLNQPEQTAERFLPDTVAGTGRMYRTGDRGRVLADGSLIVSGRLDDQVKIRGYRIEPSEIEAQLRAFAADCAVVVDRSAPVPRLLAFVTGPRLAADRIQRELVDRLPAYMIPSRLTVLTELPRTRNGKLDTHRLIALSVPAAGTATTSRLLPTVCAVWREVLGQTDLDVDVDASFFEIGGSSLSLVRVASRLQEETSLDIGIPALFQFPTARSLAGHLERLQSGPDGTGSPKATFGAPRRIRGRQRTR